MDDRAMTSSSVSARRRVGAWGVALLGLGFVLGWGWARFAGSFQVSLFTDRELARGLLWTSEVQVLGAETTGELGARVPGFLLPLLFGLPQALGGDASAVYALQTVMAVLALLVLGLGLRDVVGALPALVAVVIAAASTPFLDTVESLWNPGFLPLFTCAGTVGLARLVALGDRRGLVLLVVAGVLGAQLHLSLYLWLLACLPVIVVALPPRSERTVAVALGLAALAWVPYVVVEASGGWPNTGLFFADGLPHTRRFLGNLREALLLAAAVPIEPGRTFGWPERAQALGAGVAGVTAAVSLVGLMGGWRGRGARLGAGLGVPVALLLLLISRTDTPQMHERYLMPLLPSVAALAALGMRQAIGFVARRRPALGGLLAVGALVALAPLLGTLRLPHGTSGHAALLEDLAALRARTGWTLEEVVGRTTWSHGRVEAAGALPLAIPLDHLLPPGLGFPGSAPPPCALVLEARADVSGWTPEALVERLVPGAAPLRGTAAVEPLPSGRRLLVFDAAATLCPSTTVQCYVRSAPEQAALDGLRDAPCGEVITQIVGDGSRFLVEPGTPRCTGIHLAVEVQSMRQRGLQVRLASPNLRGACDTPSFTSGVLRDPRLVLVSSAGVAHAVPLHHGLLGGRAAAAPVRVLEGLSPWPEAPVRLVLQADVAVPPRDATWPPSEAAFVPWEVVLDEAFTP